MTVVETLSPPHTERDRLVRLAYRMLGSVSEAEDVVQDAFMRLSVQAPPPRTPSAWLTTVTTRLAIDRLRRIKARRETYPGPWLPDPVATADEEPTGDLSVGYMLMLERLSPEERAAFTLREGFDTAYSDIAAMLDKSEAAVRQLVSRARDKLRRDRPARAAPTSGHMAKLNDFVSAVASGDIAAVRSVLAADVRLVTDGGGRRSAALRIVEGRDAVAGLVHFLTGKDRKVESVRILSLNGAPGLLIVDDEGDRIVVQVETTGEAISAIYVMRNPEKLRHIAML